jgi:cytochrome c553
VLFTVTALGGLVLLPYVQPDLKFSGIWDAICSAAGVPRTSLTAASINPDFKISTVVMTSDMLSHPSADTIGRGATLAQQCAICHGPTGVSRADSPNLAGQYASVVYKELRDFKSGARVNGVMTPFALPLSEQDMLDLAAYYAYLPRLPAYHPNQITPAPRIVVNGAPMRNVAPCGSCHGGLDNKAGSPWLEGQSAVYMKSQLQAFASGARRNDISGQMRNIARQMTPDEMDQAARYYASQPSVYTTIR